MRNSAALLTAYGPWALVTGASDGIGRALADQLAQAGFHLVLVARRGEILRELAEAWKAAHGTQTRILALDLTEPDAVDRVVNTCADLEIGLLAAAAGFGTSGPFLKADLNIERQMLALNCAVPLAMVHAFGRLMAQRRKGGIILMSSLFAFQGVPGAAAYAASKAYIQVLVEGLRKELAKEGVSVVASAPGPVLSGFGNRARMSITSGTAPEAVAQGTLAALGARTTVRPGLLSKVLEGSMAPLPRSMRTFILSKVIARMTHRS